MSESTAFRHQMPILTLREVKKNFSFREPADGRPESYHGLDIYLGRPDFCDIYFISENKEVNEQQIDIFNRLKEHIEEYVGEIKAYLDNSIFTAGNKSSDAIRKAALDFEAIEIPFLNREFDLWIECSKTYRKFGFFNRKIVVRAQIKNDKIISVSRR